MALTRIAAVLGTGAMVTATGSCFLRSGNPADVDQDGSGRPPERAEISMSCRLFSSGSRNIGPHVRAELDLDGLSEQLGPRRGDALL